ncbi:DUF5658 family protein [Clostridium sardiniense]|uniref:DUF5658 family protein n=1 Tax=Clostridium sardiniense TaxID=29369 RepID=A0ABS7L0F0_CLOSR|nr:DUF5658 family protein [Clostridium sardiniense]
MIFKTTLLIKECCLIFLFLFIKGYSYTNIKKKLQLLYILNISDIILTLILLKTGLFKEVNGIMVNIVENPLISIFIKVGLVGLLIYYLIKRMTNATNKQLLISNFILNGALGIYCIINLMHISYIFLYLIILNII